MFFSDSNTETSSEVSSAKKRLDPSPQAIPSELERSNWTQTTISSQRQHGPPGAWMPSQAVQNERCDAADPEDDDDSDEDEDASEAHRAARREAQLQLQERLPALRKLLTQ